MIRQIGLSNGTSPPYDRTLALHLLVTQCYLIRKSNICAMFATRFWDRLWHHFHATMRSNDSERDSSAEYLLEKEGQDSLRWKDSKSRYRWPLWLTLLNIVIFGISVSLSVHRLVQDRFESTISLLRKTSFYCKFLAKNMCMLRAITYADFPAPIFDTIQLDTKVLETNGSLFAPTNPSRFRNEYHPDPVVNDAWEELEFIRVFPMTEEQVRKLGKDPEMAVRFPEEYGLGSEAYVGQIDVFHQIHCLNLLRHLAWAEFDRDEKVGKKPYSTLHWVHVSHCTDILMQNLMCNGNLDVITFNWMEDEPLPFPDFNVKHQCRDFDAIIKWQEEYTVPKELGRNFTKPDGVKQISIDTRLAEIAEVVKGDYDGS